MSGSTTGKWFSKGYKECLNDILDQISTRDLDSLDSVLDWIANNTDDKLIRVQAQAIKTIKP